MKLIRDGKVAVLISPDFGAGWSTWADKESEEILFDSRIVELVENGGGLTAFMEEHYPNVYLGGASDLVVEWLPIGTKFQVHEYDGSESLIIADEQTWIEA